MEEIYSFPLSIFEETKKAENFICCVCLDVPSPDTALEHVSCGRIFCCKCAEEWKKSSNGSRCPSCNANNFNSALRNIKTSNRLVFNMFSSLVIHCTSTVDDDKSISKCIWKGEWKELKSHREVCEETMILCKLDCKQMFRRKATSEHEKLICPNKLEECKFCTKKFKAFQLNEHCKDCDLNPDKIYDCDYSSIGCKYKGRKTEVQIHLTKDMADHLKLYRAKFSPESVKNVQEVSNASSVQLFYSRCENGHELKPRGSLHNDVECNICGATTTSNIDFECRQCDYDCCWRCYYYNPFPLICPQNHTHVMMFSIDIRSDKCYKCKLSLKDKKYWCPTCKINMCLECRSTI